MIEKRPDRARGPVHDEFWAWCKEGELRLQHCAACNRLSWPPKATCEHCDSAQMSWKRMSGRGKIVSWCSFERDYYKGAFPMPWDTILVELVEGPLFISNPYQFTSDDIYDGMAVEVTFLECEDSAGQFSLPVFKRV